MTVFPEPGSVDGVPFLNIVAKENLVLDYIIDRLLFLWIRPAQIKLIHTK